MLDTEDSEEIDYEALRLAERARERADYVAGLRLLADALADDEGLPLPFEGTLSNFSIFCHDRDQLLAWTRVLPGRLDKKVDDDASAYGFTLKGLAGGIPVHLRIDRDEVCRRVVKGTTALTTTIPDPDYVALAPMVERTEVVEDVEWVCEPLLAERTA